MQAQSRLSALDGRSCSVFSSIVLTITPQCSDKFFRDYRLFGTSMIGNLHNELSVGFLKKHIKEPALVHSSQKMVGNHAAQVEQSGLQKPPSWLFVHQGDLSYSNWSGSLIEIVIDSLGVLQNYFQRVSALTKKSWEPSCPLWKASSPNSWMKSTAISFFRGSIVMFNSLHSQTKSIISKFQPKQGSDSVLSRTHAL